MLDHMNTSEITIRPEYPDDELALIRLATLDSSDRAPARPLLLAEVDGELRAALSLHDGSAIADPFKQTAALLELLRSHAKRTAAAHRRPLARSIKGVARGMRTGRRTPAWSR
jgi:hypothetical protein